MSTRWCGRHRDTASARPEVELLERDDEAGAARGEGTAERQASALALAAHLGERAAPPNFDDDADILVEYVRWVEEEAPREVRRHADPEAVVRGSKRRARRVRARKAG